MARKSCSICDHPKRKAIEKALGAPGASARAVAKTFGVVARTLDRHKLDCLPSLIAAVISQHHPQTPPPAAVDSAIAADLLYKVEALQAHTLEILANARQPKPDASGIVTPPSPKIQLAAIKEARHNLTLIARLQGRLDGGADETQRAQMTYEEFHGIYLAIHGSRRKSS